MADETTPLGQAYQAYERLEGQLSVALDKLVATNGFADLLATSATNVMALTRLANGTVDKVVRSTRLAARRDVTDLARQLARTEAKLERLLQAVEELQGQLDVAAQGTPPAVAAPAEPAAPTRGEVSSATAPPAEAPAPPAPPAVEPSAVAPSAVAPSTTPRNGTVNGVSRARAPRTARTAKKAT